MGVFLLDDLKAYYNLDELVAADTRVDSHTGGHDLVAVGTGVNPDAGGKLNGCTRGTQNINNYLNAPHSVDFRPTAVGLTVAGWLQAPAGTLTVNQVGLAHWQNTDRSWIWWGRNAVDQFAFTMSNNGTTSINADWGVSYIADVWYFVVGFADPLNNRIGIQVDRGTTVFVALTAPFHQATQPLTHQFFSGTSGVPSAVRCDEVGIWGRILNTEELDALYNSGGTPPGYSSFVTSEVGITAPPCRETIVVVELDQDQCRLIYGEAPCGAALGTTADRKCYNTRATCQDRENYDSSPTVSDSEAVPQDISNAGAEEATFDVTTEEAIPTGLTFKPDGTKLYVIGQDSDQVRQYPLTTPWDISTAGSVEASFSVIGAETSPQAVFWKSDGLRLYIVGTQNDQVRQYIVTTAFDISTAGALEASHSVAGEDTSPQGLFFKSDGQKLYVCGGTSDSVHQYGLTTAWDINSAGAVEESFDVSGEELDPQGIYFGSQGTKLYVIGTQSDNVHQYPLSTAWDLSTVGAVEASFDVSGDEQFPSDLTLSVDGTKLYIVGVSGLVRQYPISGVVAGIARDAAGTADIDSTGAVEASFDVSTEDNDTRGVSFKPDGTKLYMCGAQNEEVHQYPLTVPWDISSAGSVEAAFTDGSSTNPGQIFWKPDGTRLFILEVGFGGVERVSQHTASTPFDLSSVSTSTDGVLVVQGEETTPDGLFFKFDGTKVYVTGLASAEVHQYPLATAWDLATAGSVETSFDVSTEESNPTGIFFRADGAKLYVVGTTSDEVHQYPLSTAWDVSTAGAVESSFDVSGEDIQPRDLFFKDDGTKLFMIGDISNEVHQYPIPLLEGNIHGALHIRSFPTGFSQALSFDGDDDSVEVVDNNDRYGFAGTNAFSVEFILDPRSLPTSFATLFSKIFVDGSGAQGWRIRLRQSDTTIVFDRLLNGSADSASAAVSLTEARFWSAVYDGTDLILYDEGVEKARTTSANIITTSSAPLLIGNILVGDTTETFDGNLDEVRIWQDARTEAEIRARMVLPISGLEADLVSYFPFDSAPIGVATRTLRFTKPQTTAPRDLYLVPLLVDVNSAPTRLNPGGGSRDRGVLGDRASVDIGFKDAPGSDRVVDKYRAERISGTAQTDEPAYEPLDRGSYWAKWRARNLFFQNRRLRVLEGYIAEDLRDMQTREYFIDQFRGPDADGRTVVRAKDVLKLADDERAQAPDATPGELSAALTAVETTSFQATGALIADYPDEPGLVRIGGEVIEYLTRTQATADNVQFNTLTRGARGSEADAHDAEDRVQRCLEFVNVLPWKLAEDLLVNFGNVPQEFIPIDDWDAEGEVWLVQFTLSAVITEPTSVTALLSEITQQAQFFLWWDEYTQTVKLKALRPPVEDPVELDEVSHLIQDASVLKEHPNQRLSQVWVFFNQKDPTRRLDDESNFARVRIRADLEAEDSVEYGEKRISKIFSRWLETEGQVLQVTKRTLDRYRDNPRTLKIRADAKDRDSLRVGEVADITMRTVVDDRGLAVSTRWQIVSTREEPPGEAVSLELREFEFTGRFAFYMEDAAPTFAAATEKEKKSGAWYAQDDGKFSDGTDGYQYQ